MNCKSAIALLILASSQINIAQAEEFKVLTQLADKPIQLSNGKHKDNFYVPSTFDTISWGYLPNSG